MAIEEFLETTSTQCTEEGLKSVFRNMRNNELGVFFRNNHFSVIFKRDNRYVLSLVTDEGFIDEPSIVWEIVYDNGAIDSDDIHHAEEINDEALARLMREQRARERENRSRDTFSLFHFFEFFFPLTSFSFLYLPFSSSCCC